VTLLGPQRRPTVDRVLASLGVDGPVAAVNAGWQDREADDGELLSLLGGRGVNLRLHARWMSVLHDDPEYARAEREHLVVLDEMRQLYRIRLEHALRATYEVAQRTDGHPRSRESALADAIEILRVTDQTHLSRVRDLQDAFADAWSAHDREAIAKHRHEVRDVLTQATCLVMAGGHVGVLLHVLRLFDVSATVPARVVAWSAGAMALTERVVLFHDRAAHGSSPTEVLDEGVAAVRGVVALPHARRRLRTDDGLRMSVFARRFAPAVCLVLDDGLTVELGLPGDLAEEHVLPPDARVITTDGRLVSTGER
jgi:hypothetical protein